MWNNDSFSGGRGGGGFVPGDGRSPAVGDKGQSRIRRTQNFFPLAIRQVLEAPEETIRIGDTEVATFTVVGLVKSVETSSTKITYVLDDQTGSVEAVTYIGTDDNDTKSLVLRENTYGRVVGSVRTKPGGANEKYVICFKAFPVLDMNEVTCHALEVLQVPMKMKKLQEQHKSKMDQPTPAGNTLSNSMMGNNLGETTLSAGGDSVLNGLNSTQGMVFRCIQSVKTEEGIDIKQIVANLKNKVAESDARSAIEFLSGEGHIYSTIDDNHYKCTDW